MQTALFSERKKGSCSEGFNFRGFARRMREAENISIIYEKWQKIHAQSNEQAWKEYTEKVMQNDAWNVGATLDKLP